MFKFCKVNWNNENCFNILYIYFSFIFLLLLLLLFRLLPALNSVSLLNFFLSIHFVNFHLLDTRSLFIYICCTRILFYAQWLPWWTLCNCNGVYFLSFAFVAVVNLNGKHRYTHGQWLCVFFVQANNFTTLSTRIR